MPNNIICMVGDEKEAKLASIILIERDAKILSLEKENAQRLSVIEHYRCMVDGMKEKIDDVEKENKFLKSKIDACRGCSADCTGCDFNK